MCERCGRRLTIIPSNHYQDTRTEPKCKECGTDIPREIVRGIIAATAGAVACYIVMGYRLVDAMDLL